MSQKDCLKRYDSKFHTVSIRFDDKSYQKMKSCGKSINRYVIDLVRNPGTDLGIDPQLMKDLPAYARAAGTDVPNFINTLLRWQYDRIDRKGPENETERGFKYHDL